MNYVVIFAGGSGQRMHSEAKPKQFLNVHGKPIIIHTIEHFEKCDKIDGIIIVCISSHIEFMKKLIIDFSIKKVLDVIPGGSSGQESIYNGLEKLKQFVKSDDDIVLIHDGVRPIINQETICENISCVKKYGSAITIYKSIETICKLSKNDTIDDVIDRNLCSVARAPQSFYFKDIYKCHTNANKENKHDFIDSAMLMDYYGYKLHTVLGPDANIKITTPLDFFLFKAILDFNENKQIKEL